jgi:hypothetical protein
MRRQKINETHFKKDSDDGKRSNLTYKMIESFRLSFEAAKAKKG